MELSLLAKDRGVLEQLVARSKDVRQLKRAQALLAVAAGEAIADVARRLRVARNTIYNWTRRFQERPGKVAERLVDAERSGRPADLIQGIREALPKLLAKKPPDFGYRHAEWTVDLLQAQLRLGKLDASDKTIRTALHELGYRWKRPRFVLRRRPDTWRQSKGGSSGG
jgi:transposase